MSNILRMGNVFIQDIYAGQIRETDEGYEYEYDSEYLKRERALPVSLTLPLTSEKYTSKYLFSFFDGLIPEGWLLNIALDNWKIDVKDRFGIMLVACRDCIGDVNIEAVNIKNVDLENDK